MLDVAFLGAIAFAVARAWQARFWGGLVAAVLRLALVIASAIMLGVSLISSTALVGAPMKLGLFVAGPVVSFVMVVVTWRRTRDVPYLQEDLAHRVFMPWVVIACVDAVGVALGLFAVTIARDV